MKFILPVNNYCPVNKVQLKKEATTSDEIALKRVCTHTPTHPPPITVDRI